MTHPITRNDHKRRYEIHVDGTLAGFTDAHEDGEIVTFPHTVVFDDFSGQGIAGQLLTGALDDVRSRGQKIVAECTFVARFVEKNPEYGDLLV